MSSYLGGNFNAPPPARDWTIDGPRFELYANDRVGCCAFAAQAHMIHTWQSMSGVKFGYPITSDVLAAYSSVTGFRSDDPRTDRGTVMLDALKHWRKVGLGGHKISAFVQLDLANRLQVEAAINLFGGIYVGAMLPTAAQTQTVWDIAPPNGHGSEYGFGSWGGHVMACALYSRSMVGLVTWGGIKFATWEWLYSYADEVYAVIGDDWSTAQHVAPNGFDFAKLRADLDGVSA